MNANKEVIPVTVRIPTVLKKQLEVIGDDEHWSFNQTVVEAIKAFISNHPTSKDGANTFQPKQ